ASGAENAVRAFRPVVCLLCAPLARRFASLPPRWRSSVNSSEVVLDRAGMEVQPTLFLPAEAAPPWSARFPFTARPQPLGARALHAPPLRRARRACFPTSTRSALGRSPAAVSRRDPCGALPFVGARCRSVDRRLACQELSSRAASPKLS